MDSGLSTTAAMVNLTLATTTMLNHLPPFIAADLFVSSSGALTSVPSLYDSASSISAPEANTYPAFSQLLYTTNASSSLASSLPPGVLYSTSATGSAPTSHHHSLRSLERLVEVSYLYRTLVAAIYFVTAFIAFVVNFLALLILFFGRRKSRQLNRFLSNLGFSDIIFAIFNIPFTYITLIYNTWWLPEFLCPLTSFVQVLAPTVAFYTLIAIGIGRYFVIVTGHESLLLTKSSNTKYVVTGIWLLAILIAAPMLFATRIRPVVYGNQTFVECTEDWSGLFFAEADLSGTVYTIIVFVVTFILPVVALTYLYGHIGLIVYKHQLPVGNDNRVTNRNLTQTKIKAVKMLLLLVISFIICWSPCQIFYLLLWVFADIRQDDSASDEGGGHEQSVGSLYSTVYYTVYFIFHWLSCSHTIINPFIYCFFSSNFQKSDLYAILSCNIETAGSRASRKSVVSQYANNSTNFNTTNRDNSIRIGAGGGGDPRRSSLLRKSQLVIGSAPAATAGAIAPNDSIVTLKFAPHTPLHSQV